MKNKKYTLASCVLLLLVVALNVQGATRWGGGGSGAGAPWPRVVAGFDAPSDGPNFVLRAFSYSPTGEPVASCTHSLITQQWTLTAAHCLLFVKPNCSGEINLMYNDFNTPPPQNKHVRKSLLCFRHLSYAIKDPMETTVDPYHSNDIGLVMLDKKITTVTHLGKLSAVDFRSLIGRSMKYYGFGITVTDNVYIYQSHTDKVKKMLMNDNVRNLQYGEALAVKCDLQDRIESEPSAFICVRPKCSRVGQRATFGDTGGPLMYKGKIIGVTCGGPVMGDMYHMAYTAVSPYLSWIKVTMSANNVDNNHQ